MKLSLPSAAVVNKFIPKSKFLNQSFVNTKLKQEVVDQIQKISWKYKIAEDTVGIAKTAAVEEIQVFELELKKQLLPKKVIKLIQRSIPYPILFVLTYKDQTAYAIVLDTVDNKYEYYIDWDTPIDITFTGSNLEKVYTNVVESFITSISTSDRPFTEVIALDLKIKQLCKDVERFESKIRKEKQFNKKVALNQELLNLKKELLELQKA